MIGKTQPSRHTNTNSNTNSNTNTNTNTNPLIKIHNFNQTRRACRSQGHAGRV